MDSSSSTPSSSYSPEVEEPKRPRTKVPLWVPVSAFVGTSLALAIPLLMIRRQRTSAVARLSLKGSVAPPPRRNASTGRATLPTNSASSSSASMETVVEAYSSEGTSPGMGEMMSALSKMNKSSAILAAKAFGIATALVVVSGAGLVWGVKQALGVQDVREFGTAMRSAMWNHAPDLTQRILRPPEDDDERQQVRQVLPPSLDGEQEEWNWEKSEKRLKRAYDEGGFPLWAQTALRELEAEARLERAKREKEFANAKS